MLAFLLVRAFPKPLGRVPLPGIALALLVFATLEEISQSLFAARTASLVDLACSFLGIAAGTWLARPGKAVLQGDK